MCVLRLLGSFHFTVLCPLISPGDRRVRRAPGHCLLPPPAPRPFTRLRSGPWGTSCEIRTLCRACGVGPRGREPARPGVWLCACPCVVRVCLCTLCVCVIYVCLWYSVCGGCAGRVHVCVRCALAFAQQGHFLSPSAPPAPSASSVDGSSPGTCASRVSDPRPGQKSASAPRREGAGCFPGFKEQRPFLSSTGRPPFSWPEGVQGPRRSLSAAAWHGVAPSSVAPR